MKRYRHRYSCKYTSTYAHNVSRTTRGRGRGSSSTHKQTSSSSLRNRQKNRSREGVTDALSVNERITETKLRGCDEGDEDSFDDFLFKNKEA